MRTLLILATVLSLAATDAAAYGGCPSSGDGCTMATQIGVKLEPRLSCLVLDIDSDDCSCTAAITVYNDCAADVLASDFEFSRCEDYNSWDSMIFDCLVLPPGWQGEIDLPLEQAAPNGYYEDTLNLVVDGEQHALDLRYEMAHVSLGGCGCATSSEPSIPFGALLLIGVALARALSRTRED